MEKLAVMIFDSNDEVQNFLSSHKDLKLLDKKTKKFLVVETEMDENKQYINRIVARFISKNNELVISELERYKNLTENAKRIIDSVHFSNNEEQIKIQIGKSLLGITVDRSLYYEVFNFATDNGLKYARYNTEDGEELMICLDVDGLLILK